ncbi:MAG: YdeI/OmpD-associated family protein [Brevefilum sp.]|nr:YdeI/OmpD-associated family protein [Brevefilum sp.]
MATKKFSFKAKIEEAYNGGAYVTVPFDVEEAFGMKRVKVKATIAGYPYRGLLTRMGTADHILIVIKDIRKKAGVNFGDEIEVEVEEDTEPRVVTIPEDVRQALADHPEVGALFEKLSYSARKEYMFWVESAKRAETRQNRILKMLDLLKQGKKGPYGW